MKTTSGDSITAKMDGIMSVCLLQVRRVIVIGIYTFLTTETGTM